MRVISVPATVALGISMSMAFISPATGAPAATTPTTAKAPNAGSAPAPSRTLPTTTPAAPSAIGALPQADPAPQAQVVVRKQQTPWYLQLGAILGLAAFPVTFLVALRNAGAFNRVDYEVIGTYLPHTDILDFHTLPAMEILLRNRGTVAITLSDFRLGLARIGDNVYDPAGPEERGETAFTYQTGGTLMLDGRTVSSVGTIQQFSKIDYRSHTLNAPPKTSQRYIVDFEAMFPDFDHTRPFQRSAEFEDFHPVLMFRSSTGEEFHMDSTGCHHGQYRYPYDYNEQPHVVMAVQVWRPRSSWRRRTSEGSPRAK